MPTELSTSEGSLLQELKQNRPFRSPAQEALIGIARTASVLNRLTAAVLEPEGISVAQYNVLRILRGAGTEGLPTLSIRDRMIDPAAAITRLVDKLEEGGLITRERVSCDRRQVVCRITGAGLALLDKVEPALTATEECVGATIGAEDLGQLNRIMTRMRNAVR